MNPKLPAAVLATILTASTIASAADEETYIYADIAVLEEVYKTVHAQRKDFTEHGLYPGMSRYEVAMYASQHSDGDANIYPNTLTLIVFETPGKALEVKATFEDQDKAYRRMLREEGRKPDDRENFADRIQIVENHDPATFDANTIIQGFRAKYGEPVQGKTKPGFVQMIYKHETTRAREPGQQCIAEAQQAGNPNAYAHGAALSKPVEHMRVAEVEAAMAACPGSIETFKKRLAADLGPILDIRVQTQAHRVVYILDYAAGHTMRSRNATKYLEEKQPR